jgi:hypothetical protein
VHLTLELDFMTRQRLPLFCCLVAFILTFFVTRTIVRYIRSHAASDAPRKWWQPRNIGHGTLHIHHVVIGVILVMVSGVAMVTLSVDGGLPEFTVASIFFGIGAALVLDEFALILHLQDVYWAEDGRTSVDAVFAAVAVAGLLMLGLNPLSFFDIGIWRDGCSFPRCCSSGRSGYPARMRRGRAGSIPTGHARCTGRWSPSAGSAGRWCRPSCGYSTSLPASRTSPTTARSTGNSTVRSTPHRPRRTARRPSGKSR